jgi:soluble lytic murein transglycosylase-like protein
MTWRQSSKSLTLAGFAMLTLAAISQVRAESGEGGVYADNPVGSAPAAETAAASAPSSDESPAEPAKTRSGRAAERNRTDATRSAAVKPLIVRYASENQLPVELADAVIRVESRYNARARNGANVGLTQINAGTARAMGYKGETAGLLDAETNLRYGLKYLAQAYKLAGGDTCGTILRFQAGHRAQAMTRAAKTYCSKIQSLLAAAI